MTKALLQKPHWDLASRLRAAGAHLLVSLLVAAAAGALVFGLWYPGVFRSMAGGRELFLLVICVDVVIGPVLTFAVFDRAKGWPHLRRDLWVIAILQLAALGYGLHTVFIARPVAMIFEVDRLRLLAVVDVWEPELGRAPPQYRTLPLTGPWLLAAREPAPGDERNDALAMGMKGIDIGQRPLFWKAYDDAARLAATSRSRPVALLRQHEAGRATDLDAALRGLNADAASSRFLPVGGARGDWVAVLNASGDVLGYLAFDGWF